MSLSNRKNNIFIAAIFAAMIAVPVTSAREDGGGGPNGPLHPFLIAPVAAPQVTIPEVNLAGIEPGDGGRMDVAAVPKAVETPSLKPQVTTGKRLGTFGSVAISAGKLPFAKKWRGVTGADYATLFSGDCSGFEACDSKLALRLQKARSAAAGQSGIEALETINAAVNSALAYGADRANWGRGDYWATPAETLSRGVGDCEDFAIAKLWLLRSLGFDANSLQLVVLEDTKKGVYHAVLAVHQGGERYILDNLSSRVRPDSAFPSYFPIMSFVAERSYIHGFETQRSDLADMPADLASVSPGEGV